MPATLSLTLGSTAPSFGNFTPGIDKTYDATGTANVISTAGDALLSVADPSSTATGHLVNGAFSLPDPLTARARNADGNPPAPAFNNVGSSASPLNLLTWNAPISNDAGVAGLPPAHRRQRRASHRQLQQDADVHTVHDDSVSNVAEGGRRQSPAWQAKAVSVVAPPGATPRFSSGKDS